MIEAKERACMGCQQPFWSVDGLRFCPKCTKDKKRRITPNRMERGHKYHNGKNTQHG